MSRFRHPHGTRRTGLPAKPDWYPREGAADAEGGWVETAGSPDLYDAEVRAAGPAGTVVAWAPGTFHRGTALTLPRGAATRSTSLPAGSCRVGRRWPGPAAATNSSGTGSRTGRHHGSSRSSASPPPRSPVPDRSHPRRHGRTVPRAEHDPVAASVARRRLTWRRNRPNLSVYGSDQRFCVWL